MAVMMILMVALMAFGAHHGNEPSNGISEPAAQVENLMKRPASNGD